METIEGTLVEVMTPEQAARWVAEAWQDTVAAIVETGARLREAKKRVGHGRWDDAVALMPFKERTARYLMAVANHSTISNRQYTADLPASWSTLAVLSQLPEDKAEEFIANGKIHPGLEQKAAKKLLKELSPATDGGGDSIPVCDDDIVEDDLTVEQITLEPARPGWHQLGRHRLYCGSSTDQEFIDACDGAAFAFADPPYNAGKADWDHDFVWEHDYLSEVAGIVAVTPGIASMQDFLRLTAMPYRWTVSVELTNGMTRGALGFGNWVAVNLFTDGSLFRQAKDVLHVAAGTNADKGGIHPSRKPIRVLTGLLELFTSPGDVVIDPFLGSGTTLLAAEIEDRVCIGAELDPTYCAHIIDRYRRGYEDSV